jgi:hypothetical protein
MASSSTDTTTQRKAVYRTYAEEAKADPDFQRMPVMKGYAGNPLSSA